MGARFFPSLQQQAKLRLVWSNIASCRRNRRTEGPNQRSVTMNRSVRVVENTKGRGPELWSWEPGGACPRQRICCTGLLPGFPCHLPDKWGPSQKTGFSVKIGHHADRALILLRPLKSLAGSIGGVKGA